MRSLPLLDAWTEAEEERWQIGFPQHEAGGLVTIAIVLQPGDRLAPHTDSADELFVVVEGEVEIEAGGERRTIAAPGLATAPALVTHRVRNVGASEARIVAVFAAERVESVFERPVQPSGQRELVTPLPPEVLEQLGLAGAA